MVDEAITEEEKRQAKAGAEEAARKLRQKLSQPGAEVKYGAFPSSVLESMSSGWGDGL